MGNNLNCDFCDENIIALQEIIKSSKIRILYPRRPIIEEHLLFVPIRHIERFVDLESEEVIDLLVIVNKINGFLNNEYKTTGFNLFINDGKAAGQHIPHVHFHFFGRSESEKNSPYKILNNPVAYNITKLSDSLINERIDKIRRKFLKL